MQKEPECVSFILLCLALPRILTMDLQVTLQNQSLDHLLQ